VYSTEKFLADNADKIADELKSEVQADVDGLKKALESDDVEGVRSAVSKLGESSQKMGAAMYAAAGAESAAGGTPDAGDEDDAGSEDVVEAEIVDEDEAK